ncbi:lipid-A-disaccharide synthase [Hellea balneolensis]|uniref:lipid-A-disaccharide synthase n=1 Tax=Hellea balneolensis TaxID=287478 RepID=UPI0004050B3F|nr:lipid-A-disaccharide synthase [Hellea balneolensis]
MTPSIYIVAVENSADHLGAELANHIRAKVKDVSFIGIGGPAMAETGIISEIDISGLAILGFVEGLKSYPMILERVNATVESIVSSGADAVILIDSWGFMIRVAKGLKKAGYDGKIIKYLAPQVWAMREGRSKILAKYVDHLLTIHSFDAPYFEKHGLPVSYIGNPMFDTDYRQGDGRKLRRELGIDSQDEVVSIFFGSRLSEIQQLAKPFADAVALLKSERARLKFISPVSESIATDVNAAAGQDLRLQDVILLPEARKFDVFAASDVALACSGTITTQLACAGVPSVVAYRLNGLTYAVAKKLYKPDYISIVNIAADQELMPEFIQGDVTGENLAEAIVLYLENKTKREEASNALIAQTDRMKGKGGSASERAALTVLEIIGA